MLPELLYLGGRATWKNPELTALNRLPMRAHFVPYASAEEAQRADEAANDRQLSLNGDWKFFLFEKPEAVPAEILTGDGDTAWRKLPVPSNWAMHGHDKPRYTNHQMPFAEEPPEVPEENPTGAYVRSFEVPADWSGQRVIFYCGGAESVLYVYCNGKAIGMSKDTRLPGEFDLTEAINYGAENRLVCLVVKWSDASFIEDQDQWWLGGIFREVCLYARPEVSLRDLQLSAGLDDWFSVGEFSLTAKIDFPAAPKPGYAVSAELYGPFGTLVLAEPMRAEVVHEPRKDPSYGHAVIRKDLPDVTRWTPESPHLYTLLVSLETPEGVAEAVCLRFGFRDVRVHEGLLKVNGKPIMVHGVNRHEHDDQSGKVIRRERMRQEALLMKRFNFNTVRCSHYPPDPYWFQLCDELGLMVIDEANIESHALQFSLCHETRYAPAIFERCLRMVERDKNFTSIILWSLGNESGYGAAHDAAAGWIRHADPSRPLHYEGAIDGPNRSWSDGKAASDIICPMYAPPESLDGWDKDPKNDRSRPLIFCEYSHAMGNSNGGLADYYEKFEQYRWAQGGCIWEWIDHGLRQISESGEPFWAYGGDFGDEPNDANFVCDGLVWPDLVPHPAMFEFKQLAQPVKIELVELEPLKISITNKRLFSNLEDYKASWEMLQNGEVISKGSLPLPKIRPGRAAELTSQKAKIPPEGEIVMHFRVQLREKTSWAPAGHTVAWNELMLRERNAPIMSKPAILPEKTDTEVTFVKEASRLVIDRKSGTVKSWQWGDDELLADGPTLNFWRAATDNDGIKRWSGQENKPLGRWRALGLPELKREVRSVSGEAEKLTVREVWLGNGEELFDCLVIYGMEEGGGLMVSAAIHIAEGAEDLPRVGMTVTLPKGWHDLSWYGRGPWENYPDRKAAAQLKVHRSTVGAQYVPYIMPQENGNHCDTRWLTVGEPDGPQLEIRGIRPFHFSARPYSDEQLYQSCHTTELVPSGHTYLQLDTAHRGLGTASCGPDTLEAYRLKQRRYNFAFLFKPL